MVCFGLVEDNHSYNKATYNTDIVAGREFHGSLNISDRSSLKSVIRRGFARDRLDGYHIRHRSFPYFWAWPIRVLAKSPTSYRRCLGLKFKVERIAQSQLRGRKPK
jgi:hypothetical protein